MTRDRQEIELIARGRHDPCVVPRGLHLFPKLSFVEHNPLSVIHLKLSLTGAAAVPMVESMVALVLVDQLMAHLAQCEMFPVDPALQVPISPPINGSLLMPKFLL